MSERVAADLLTHSLCTSSTSSSSLHHPSPSCPNSFSSVLLAFTLFLWEDHRLFLLRLQSSALQERRDRETSSSVSSLSFFPSVLSLGLRSGELRLWFSRVNDLWMRSAMRWSRERDSGCGAVHQLNVNGWTWRCPEETEVCGAASVFAWRTRQSVSIQSRK